MHVCDHISSSMHTDAQLALGRAFGHISASPYRNLLVRRALVHICSGKHPVIPTGRSAGGQECYNLIEDDMEVGRFSK